ncbi:MAG: methyltransferase [Acidimicrobiia bacterium]|nr:methyltransferase [Acidimicrobiia bacterium]MDH5615528.1 methyltransferase [Acidimicrobiia bacterium]
MSPAAGFDGEAWDTVATANLSDAIGRVGAMEGGIRRMCGQRMVGPAHTVLTGTGDSSSIHRALVDALPGSVVVVDAQGGTDRAVWGNVLTLAARAQGVIGAVIDGAVRDIDEIAALDFTLFARATCPAGPHKGFRGFHGVPVQCGRVVVNPGDIIVGDADGVTVVPVAQVGTVLAEVERVVTREREWIDRIRAGESSAQILGLE